LPDCFFYAILPQHRNFHGPVLPTCRDLELAQVGLGTDGKYGLAQPFSRQIFSPMLLNVACLHHRRTIWPIAFGVALLLLSSIFSRSFAGAVVEIDADKQFKFADHLFDKGAYLKSADEFQRFIFFFPEDPRLERAMYKIGLAFLNDRRYSAAVASFNAVIIRYKDTPLALRSYLMISESQRRLRAFDAAVITLRNLIQITADNDIKDEAYYRLAWIYIESADWAQARLSFAGISASSRPQYRLSKLLADLDLEKSIPRKDPRLAGVLSIVPGTGQLYVERYQDALIAFLLNAGLILAAYESFDNELYALGGLITVVEIGFYTGNIYGAVSSAHAHKFNRKNSQQFIDRLMENSKIKLSADPRSKKIFLSLEYPF